MKLYYSVGKNFGDALNLWLWPRLLIDILDHDEASLFVGIGTLLNDKVPQEPLKVVFGTGVGYGKGLPIINERWKIYCVRGPLSAKTLGIDPRLAITDAAALLRTVELPGQPKRYRASFMPHWNDLAYWNWESVCENAGIHFIDPTSSIDSVLAEIQQSKLIVAEAMHGAIVADALRVPWIPVRAYQHILPFKWMDWCQSLSLDYNPHELPPLFSSAGYAAMANKWLKYSRIGQILQINQPKAKTPSGPILRLFFRCLSGVIEKRSTRIAQSAASKLSQIASNSQPMLSSDQQISLVTDRLVDRLEQFTMDFGKRHVDFATRQ